MIVYIADRNMNILGIASTGLPDGLVIVDDNKSEDIDSGVSSFECRIAFNGSTRKQIAEMCAAGNYLLRSNGNDNGFYTIIDTEIDTKKQEAYLYAEDAGLDLLNEICVPYEADKVYPIDYYINKFAFDSGFEVGINEVSNLSRKLSWEGESTAAERIASVATQFDNAEISYSFKIDGMRVTKKYINIYKKRGSDTGIQLRLNKEVDRIIEKKSIANLATALKVSGGTPESTEENMEPKPITLDGYEYDDGDFFLDGTYLKSRKAHAVWTRYLAESGNYTGYIMKTFAYATLDQEELCNRAITELKKIREPEVNYEASILVYPDSIHIGDRVDIIDDAGGLYVSSRLLKLDESVTKGSKTATLGDFLMKDDGISESVLALSEQFQKVAQDNLKAIASAQTAQKNAETALSAANDAKESAGASGEAAKLAQQAAENAEIKASEAFSSATTAREKADAAQENAENASTIAEAVKIDVQNAQKDIEAFENSLTTIEETMSADYARKTELTEVSVGLDAKITKNAAEISETMSKVTIIDETVNTAKAEAEKAAEDASAAQQAAIDAEAKAQQAANDLATAKQNLAQLQGRADATEQEVAAAQKAVTEAQKAATEAQDAASAAQQAANKAQQDSDALAIRVTNAETELTRTAEAIELRATKIEVELGERIDTIENPNLMHDDLSAWTKGWSNPNADSEEYETMRFYEERDPKDCMVMINPGRYYTSGTHQVKDAIHLTSTWCPETESDYTGECIETGTPYTLSFDMWRNELGSWRNIEYDFDTLENPFTVVHFRPLPNIEDQCPQDSKWHRVTLTFTIPTNLTDGTLRGLRFVFYNQGLKDSDPDGNAIIKIANVWFEKGGKSSFVDTSNLEANMADLAEAITKTETAITQNAEAIELRATKTEVAANHYTKTETDAKIKVEADKISSVVQTTNGHATRISAVEQTAGGLTISLGETNKAVKAAQDTANNAKTAADNAQSTANTANTNATNAAKTATNFLEYTSGGLVVGNKSNGSWSGYRTQITSSAFNILDASGNQIASYGANKVSLGKNNAGAVIGFCNDVATISYNSTTKLATLASTNLRLNCPGGGLTLNAENSAGTLKTHSNFNGYSVGIQAEQYSSSASREAYSSAVLNAGGTISFESSSSINMNAPIVNATGDFGVNGSIDSTGSITIDPGGSTFSPLITKRLISSTTYRADFGVGNPSTGNAAAMIRFTNSAGSTVHNIFYLQKTFANISTGYFSAPQAYVTSSDRRIKSNISYDFSRLEKAFDNLQPATYTLIRDELGLTRAGFIAQDVCRALEVAGYNPDELGIVIKHEMDPDELIDDGVCLSLAYEALTPILWAKVKSLSKEIDELKGMISA